MTHNYFDYFNCVGWESNRAVLNGVKKVAFLEDLVRVSSSAVGNQRC